MDYVILMIIGFLFGAMLMVHHFTERVEVFCVPSSEVTVDQVKEFDEMTSHLDDHTCFKANLD